jgi:hypothetical protein
MITPFGQLMNTSAMLRGRYMAKSVWITAHVDLANLHSKNEYLIVCHHDESRHTFFYFHANYVFARLSLVSITPSSMEMPRAKPIQRDLHFPKIIIVIINRHVRLD